MLQNTRRQLLLGAAALAAVPLVGCSGTSNSVTVQSILDWLKVNCGFTTSVNMVIAVIVTVVSGFNAAAGAGAAVLADQATQVENLICNAVKLQAMKEQKLKSLPKGGSAEMDVVVNGVPISGTYTQL